MAANLNPNPINQPGQDLVIQANRVQNSVTVRLPNGDEYIFEVFQGQQNVTSQRDWTEICKGIAELWQKSSPSDTFETATIKLAPVGDLGDIKANDLHTKQVKILESKVTYQDTGTQDWKVKTIPQQANQVALNQLNTLGETFKQVQGVSTAAPQAAPQSANHPDTEDVIKDERLAICEGRNHPIAQHNGNAKPSAYYALADQLGSMNNQGRSQFHGRAIDQNTNDLHTELTTAIRGEIQNKTTKENWINAHISDIADALRSAKSKDAAALDVAMAAYNRKTKPGKDGIQKLTPGQIDNLLTKPNLTKQEKENLARLYLEYISNVDCKFVGKTFFETFVALHQQPNKNDFFQIVLVQEKDGKETATSIPSESIVTHRCAFIHIDENGNFSSYSRAAAANLVDLNVRKEISSTPTTRKKPKVRVPTKIVESQVKTIEIDSRGQCLDASLAYQILTRAGHLNLGGINKQTVNEFAKFLREEAVRIIRGINFPVGPRDALFEDYLRTSIESIPSDKRSRKINAILNKEQINDAEKIALRDFYADTIMNDDMKNNLDVAFLHVLPRADLNNAPANIRANVIRLFPDGIKAAIIQGETIRAKWPPDEFRDQLDYIYVNYDGVGHYQAVDTKDNATQKVITSWLVSQLRDYVVQPAADAGRVRTMLTEMKIRNEDGYKLIAKLILDYDHTQWEQSDKALPEPGTQVLRKDDKDYLPPEYGQWRIEDLSNPELLAYLKRVQDGIKLPTKY